MPWGNSSAQLPLVYLAAQIRQNTRALRASTYQALAQDRIGLMSMLVQDAELSRIWLDAVNDAADFNPEEASRLRLLVHIALTRLEKQLTSHGALQSRSGSLLASLLGASATVGGLCHSAEHPIC